MEVNGRSRAVILVSATSAGREGKCPDSIQTSICRSCVELNMAIRERTLKGIITESSTSVCRHKHVDINVVFFTTGGFLPKFVRNVFTHALHGTRKHTLFCLFCMKLAVAWVKFVE